MKPLALLLLRDPRPGHAHQTEGVALALARHTNVSVERIAARPAGWARQDFRPVLTRRWWGSPASFLRRVYGVDVAALAVPDLIVASGTKTSALAVMLKRHFGCPLVFSGLAEPDLLPDVDLQLVKSPRFRFDARTAQCAPPTIVDPDGFRARRLIERPSDLRGAEIALLIGGDSGVHRYGAADWDGMAALIRGLSLEFGVRWRVSNSRRTPRAVAEVLAGMLAAGEIAEFIDVATAGPGTMVPLLEADVIVVTEDSSSMLSDALAARRPVVALKPERVKPGLANEMVAALAALHEVAVLPMQGVSAEMFARAVSELVVSDVDPRDALASELLGRFFPARLAGA